MTSRLSSTAAMLALLTPHMAAGTAYEVDDSEIAVGDDHGGRDYSLGFLVGDIVGDIVGANPRHAGKSNARARQGHGRHDEHHGHPHHDPRGFNPPVVEYHDFVPTKMRKSQVGFIPATVLAGATAPFTTQPQKPFRPERLVIPSSIGPFFTLADFKVGNTSQFVSPDGEMPALGYSEQAVDCAILSDTAFMSQFLVLIAHNLLPATPITFSAGFFGTSVE